MNNGGGRLLGADGRGVIGSLLKLTDDFSGHRMARGWCLAGRPSRFFAP